MNRTKRAGRMYEARRYGAGLPKGLPPVTAETPTATFSPWMEVARWQSKARNLRILVVVMGIVMVAEIAWRIFR